MKITKTLATIALSIGFIPVSFSIAETLEVTIKGADKDRSPALVSTFLEVPEKLAKQVEVRVETPDGKTTVGQLSPMGLRYSEIAIKAHGGMVMRELTTVLPNLPAKAEWKLKIHPVEKPSAPGFAWKDTPGKHRDLSHNGKKIIRYMYEAIDEQDRERTYKPFHHVYTADGATFLTKGAGGKYTHHRGIYFGFSKTGYETTDGQKGGADTWHCKAPAYQIHDAIVSEIAGPVFARQQVKIRWHHGDKVLIKETRELTFIPTEEGLAIDFCSRLSTDMKRVTLDGDPQHAGFQFRASNEVSEKTANQTVYTRPDGQDKPGATRNWGGNKDQKDLPWKGQTVTVGGKRYSTFYLDNPDNPKPAFFSERNYGRFGSYFKTDVVPDEELLVRYRLFVKEGETSIEEVAAKSMDFVEGLK